MGQDTIIRTANILGQLFTEQRKRRKRSQEFLLRRHAREIQVFEYITNEQNSAKKANTKVILSRHNLQ